MKIYLNGKEFHLDEGINLMQLMEIKGIGIDTVVVEVNYQTVKLDDFKDFILKENDSIEVITFVGGG